jgi:hypothetical protein
MRVIRVIRVIRIIRVIRGVLGLVGLLGLSGLLGLLGWYAWWGWSGLLANVSQRGERGEMGLLALLESTGRKREREREKEKRERERQTWCVEIGGRSAVGECKHTTGHGRGLQFLFDFLHVKQFAVQVLGVCLVTVFVLEILNLLLNIFEFLVPRG